MKDESVSNVNDPLADEGRWPDEDHRKARISSFRLHPSSFLRVLVLISRFGLAALFLFAAGAKLWILKTFAKNVSELLVSAWINPDRWQWPVTIAIIVAEMVAVVLLLLPRTVRLGGIWSAVLLVGFSGFALFYVYVLHGEALECGCFGGIIASQLGVKTALRNLVLLVPALIVIFGHSRSTKTLAE